MFGRTIFRKVRWVVAAATLVTIGGVTLASPAAAQSVSISPQGVDFGTVVVGGVSSEEFITFDNSSDTTVELLPTVAATAGPGQFSFTSSTCEVSGAGALVVPAGSACQLGVVFEPQDVGVSSLTVEWVTPDATSEGTTDLVGEGVAEAGGCEPPAGLLSGLLNDLGSQLGLGDATTPLAQQLCNLGL